MAGFEDVILRALEKHQPASANKRERVYNSARATLANMLNNAGSLSPENIATQQQLLEDAISSIEAEHNKVEIPQSYSPAVAPSSPVVAPPSPAVAPPSPVVAPPSPVVAPSSPAVAPPVEVVDHPEKLAKPRPKSFWRRPFALLLIGTIVFAAVGIGAWWVYDQDLTMPAEMRDNSVPNPPKLLKAESSSPDEEILEGGEWVTIFETDDPIGLITPAASTAILSKDASGAFVTLKSASGDLQRSFKFVIEPGIIEAILGKMAVFELIVKSGTLDNQQFIVTCQFGTLGNCGRNRFTIGRKPKTLTFKKDFSELESKTSQKSAAISLIVDISGRGAPLDVYGLRVNIR